VSFGGSRRATTSNKSTTFSSTYYLYPFCWNVKHFLLSLYSIYYYYIIRNNWFLFSYLIRKIHRLSLWNDTTQITFLPTYPLPRNTPISIAKFLVLIYLSDQLWFFIERVYFSLKYYLSLTTVDSEWSYWLVGLREHVSWSLFLRLVLNFRFPTTAFGLGSM